MSHGVLYHLRFGSVERQRTFRVRRAAKAEGFLDRSEARVDAHKSCLEHASIRRRYPSILRTLSSHALCSDAETLDCSRDAPC